MYEGSREDGFSLKKEANDQSGEDDPLSALVPCISAGCSVLKSGDGSCLPVIPQINDASDALIQC